jgi:hypothetical protein
LSLLKSRISTYAIFSALFVLFLSSCSDGRIHEGTLEFEVTYPNIRAGSFRANMMPDKMTMKFKDNKFRTEVKKGRIMSTIFIIDCEAKTVTTLFQLGRNVKLYHVLNESEAKRKAAEFPTPIYMHTNEGDSLAGFLCRRSVAIYDQMGYPDVNLMHTDMIGLDQANWWTPFTDIEGVLLDYEVERYGIRMRFTANKFIEGEVEEKEFEIPEGYKLVTMEELEKEMEGISKTLME